MSLRAFPGELVARGADVEVAEEPLPLSWVDEEPKEEDFRKALQQLQGEDLKVPKGYVISVAQRGRFRTVHWWEPGSSAGCHRIPGEHYREFEPLGLRQPEPHEFSGRCTTCFPADRVEADVVSDVGSQSSTDSGVAPDSEEEAAPSAADCA